jgi:8-oxo-dGTP pyrophosphatase MutT (NUDIX family)
VRFPIAVRRAALRAAYTGLRVYWFLARPEVRGVKCVLTKGDRVLLVRHTYGDRRWDLPGGRTRRGEPGSNTARREMHEELGVLIEDWSPIGVVSGTTQFRRDRMQIFQAEMRDGEIEIDLGELAAMRWFAREELPANVPAYVPQILGSGRQ